MSYFKLSFRNLLRNRKRTLSTIFTIVYTSLILILAMSFSDGVSQNLEKNVLSQVSGHANVYGVEYIRGKSLYRIDDVDKVRESIKNEIPEAKIIDRILVPDGRISNPYKSVGSMISTLIGIDTAVEDLFLETATVVDGNLDSIKITDNVIITDATAEELELKVGDVLSFTGTIEHTDFGMVSNTVDLTIGCIIRDIFKSDSVKKIYVNKSTARQFTYFDDKQTSMFLVYIENSFMSKHAQDVLTNAFEKQGFTVAENSLLSMVDSLLGKSDDHFEFQVNTWIEQAGLLSSVTLLMQGVVLILSIVLSVIDFCNQFF